MYNMMGRTPGLAWMWTPYYTKRQNFFLQAERNLLKSLSACCLSCRKVKRERCSWEGWLWQRNEFVSRDTTLERLHGWSAGIGIVFTDLIIARLITRAQENAHLGRGVQQRRAWMQAVDFAWLYTMIFSLRQQSQSCSNLQRRSCKRSRPKCSSGPSAMTGYWSLAVDSRSRSCHACVGSYSHWKRMAQVDAKGWFVSRQVQVWRS